MVPAWSVLVTLFRMTLAGIPAAVSTVMLVSLPAVAGSPIDELKLQAKKPPKEPEQAFTLGRSLRRAGLFADAVRVLRSAYLRAPSGELGEALRLEAARSQIAAGQHKPAMNECAGLRKLSKTKHNVCQAEAHLLWKRASMALPAADSALEQAPGNYDALVAKGRALLQLGEPSPAESALRAAIGVDSKRHEAHRYLGDLLSAAGRSSDMVAELRKAYALAPEEPDVALALAEALPPKAEAVKLLEAALAIRPDYAEALARLGFVLDEQGQRDRAEQLLRSAVSQKPREASYRARLARVLLAKGDAEGALREARAALGVVKNHGAAKLAEADALAARGEIDPAIVAYEAAMGLSPNDPAPLVHAARACLANARATTAQAFAARATASFPKWAPAWEIAGDVARKAGDIASARAAYAKALSAEGPVDRASIKQRLAALK
jgi:tetratricopeptide (TPR) repeat protein